MFRTHHIPLQRLDRNRPHEFAFIPSPDDINQIKATLGLLKLSVTGFEGKLTPQSDGWDLNAKLTGFATQPCVISAEPVRTKFNIDVTRKYRSLDEPLGEDVTLEEDFDDSFESIPQSIELVPLINEELALFLPEYPRAKGIENDAPYVYGDETIDEIEDEPRHQPFQGLEMLLNQKKPPSGDDNA